MLKIFVVQYRPRNIFKPGVRWPAHAWFLKYVYVRMSVCVFVCPPPRLLITSGVMWRDMDPMRLVKQVLQLCMAIVVAIVNGCVLEIGTRHTH